jgi:anaerobic magnesium-protoporphyrin IX monomethyl ester cyclase
MKKLSNVLLINPPDTTQDGYTNPPLGLLYLAGTLLKHNIGVAVLDCCIEGKEAIERKMFELRPDVVGITCLTPARHRAFEVAALVKEFDPNVLVVLGGVHATIMYKQILQHYRAVDCAVLGEGEFTLLEIAQGKPFCEINGIAYRGSNGELITTAPREFVKNLDDIAFPAWHLVDLWKYQPIGKGKVNGISLMNVPRVSVIFSRGCIGHCSFCSTWRNWKGYRHRSPLNMVEELELLYNMGIRHFCFADDALTINIEAVIMLCNEIIRRKLKIAFHVTTRCDKVNYDLLLKLKKAGCYNIAYGVESGSTKILNSLGKTWSINDAEKAILHTKRVGIKVTAMVLVGMVGETWQSLNQTVELLRTTKPDEVGTAGCMWILPATLLYSQCVAKGFIDDDFWLSEEPYRIYTLEYSLEELSRMKERVLNYSLQVKYMEWLSNVLFHPLETKIFRNLRNHLK